MIKHRFAVLTIATILGLITVFGFEPSASAQGAGHPLGGSRGGAAQLIHAPAYASDEILVRFKDRASPSDIASAHAWAGGHPIRTFRAVKNLTLVKLPLGLPAKDAIRWYRQHPDVLYAEPNYIVTTLAVPNDPQFGNLWGLHNTGQAGGVPDADIEAPAAWDLSTGNATPVVVVIDTGIDYTHEDLAANMFRNALDCNINGIDDDGNGFVDDCHGIDAVNGDTDPMDDHAHGTHVAGTIGAVGDNGIGVVGVNWNVRLMACKFLGAGGSGSTSGAIQCMDYVGLMKDRGVNIVATNNSWGGGGFSQALFDAIDAHRQRGILFIAAAGNSGTDNDVLPSFPANYYLPNVLAVASTTRTDARSSFSQFGRRTVHLGAPGSDIVSTTPGDTYQSFSGTSMATPHVTGVAALLKAHDPARDWRAIKNLILAGGDGNPALNDTITGKRLNAHGALTCTDSTVQSRLRPIGATTNGAVGTPINLAVLHVNCAAPNGNVTVTVDPDGESVVLQDNGSAPDQSAGDGIYSGQWTPSALGTRTLTFPGGDTVTVLVQPNYVVTPALFNYRTITGTNLNFGDDSAAQVTPPFPITFGVVNFTSLFVGSNGNINFSGLFTGFSNSSIPTTQIDTLVAPFWDDLFAIPITNQNVFWETTGTAPNREFVIEWRDLSPYACGGDPSATVTFQVVFFEGRSDILFNYADTAFGGACTFADRGGSATVGVQVASDRGTQFSLDTPSLNDNTALLWTLSGTGPTIIIAATDATATETGVTTGTFTVTRTAVSPTAPLTVFYTVAGTATAGSDYTALSGSVIIPAGSNSAVITVTPINDALIEAAETVVVTLSPAATYIVGASSVATVTITDNDGPTVTILASDSSATEAGPTTGTFIVTRTAVSPSVPLTVFYTVAGTATAGSDYTALSGSVIIPAGSNSAVIRVTPINDALIEAAETVVVTLSPAATYIVGASSAATVTITDNDRPTVTILASDSSATEAGPTTGTFTVTRTAVSPPAPLTVFYTVAGTATAGSDYTALSGSVIIPAGSNSAVIRVTPINDALIEAAETVVVTLSPTPTATYIVGASSAATVTIADNGRPTVTILASDSSATEAGPTTGTFIVTRTAVSPSVPLTVFYTVAGTATAGSDYAALSGSVIIPAGSNSAVIRVTPINDALVEPAETVVVTLSPAAAYVVGGARSATVTITSND